MKKYKYYIYPVIVLFFVLILSIFKLHGSSMGFYNVLLNGNTRVEGHIYGEPRAVRSDEYVVSTPLLISQDINNEPVVNEDVGTGINLGVNYDKPTRTIFALFKPSQFTFFLSNNIEFNFAFYWWAKYAIMLIGVYLLTLKLTKKNLLLSIFTSLLFLFTPFVEWWLPLELIGFISFAIYFFLNIIDKNEIKYTILNTLGLAYSLISFGLILYPPFQISLAWVALLLCLGYVIKKRKYVFERRNLLRIGVSVVSSILITGFFAYLFYTKFSDVIGIITNTVYPGSRFISAGDGTLDWLFNGPLNILLQKTSNGTHSDIPNQSEASNFFLLSIFLIPWIGYKNIVKRKKDKIDWLSVSLISVIILFLSWYFLPLPDWFSRITFLYMVLPQRLFIGIGFASYLLIPIFLNNNMYRFNKENRTDKLIVLLSFLLTYLVHYLIVTKIYLFANDFFKSPQILPPLFKAIGAILIFPSLLGILLLNKKRLFLGAFLGYAFLSSFMINPLSSGLDIYTETELANIIQEHTDGRWIVYDDYRWSPYVLINGGNSLTVTHLYPLFDLWEVLDPEKEYEDVYNRYANIGVSTYEEGEDLLVLNHPDSVTINIDPCDPKLKELNIKYLLFTKERNLKCGILLKELHYQGPSFYIYELKYGE
jgi:hypothetical protein